MVQTSLAQKTTVSSRKTYGLERLSSTRISLTMLGDPYSLKSSRDCFGGRAGSLRNILASVMVLWKMVYIWEESTPREGVVQISVGTTWRVFSVGREARTPRVFVTQHHYP